MEDIISILMKRDGDTYDEAKSRVDEVVDLMEDCGYDPEECGDIMFSYLELELDYIEFLI